MNSMPITDCPSPVSHRSRAISLVFDLAQRIVSLDTFLIPVALALMVFEHDSTARRIFWVGLLAAIATALAGVLCRICRRRGLGLVIYGVILAGVYVVLMRSHKLPPYLHQLNPKSTSSAVVHDR